MFEPAWALFPVSVPPVPPGPRNGSQRRGLWNVGLMAHGSMAGLSTRVNLQFAFHIDGVPPLLIDIYPHVELFVLVFSGKLFAGINMVLLEGRQNLLPNRPLISALFR